MDLTTAIKRLRQSLNMLEQALANELPLFQLARLPATTGSRPRTRRQNHSEACTKSP